MNDWVTLGVVGLIIVALVLAITLGGNNLGESKETESGTGYRLFYIEGMPCVYVTEGFSNSKTGGPSCDWSKWKGNRR